MIKRSDVVLAYQLILGRDPENDRVVDEALKGYQTIYQLREGFMASPEFVGTAARFLAKHPSFDLEEELPIQVSCDSEQLRKLLARVETTWTALGKADPYWSVLTLDIFKGDAFEQNKNQFWATGEHDLERFNAWLKRNRIVSDPAWTCLEYGCGTGRVTRALAAQFKTVTGCDISSAHLDLARRNFSSGNFSNVEFRLISSMASLNDLPAYDVLYSMIVLQHNPPPLIACTLEKLLAKLRPNGIGYFQLPTAYRGYSFIIDKYLQSEADGRMEMHVIPQRYLFEIISRCNCELLELQPDDKTGSLEFISNTVLLRKRSR